MPTRSVYKVIFHNGNQVFEMFARQIYQSDMWGFIEVEELLFGERSQVLLDPSEEKLKSEFADVKRSYIPLQAVIRIDEVEREGVMKVSDSPKQQGARISNFPFSNISPPPANGDD